MGQGYLQCADIISLDLPGVRAFTGGFILGGALGYVAVWESDDGGEGESMKRGGVSALHCSKGGHATRMVEVCGGTI